MGKLQIETAGGALLFEHEAASLKELLKIAVAASADLRGANLGGANLGGAHLRDANLRDADLRDADLRDADLRGANGLHRDLVTPLRILLEQPGQIRAYKLVTAEGVGPFNGGITYKLGGSYEVADADANELVACGVGINLCTLDWALKEWCPGYRILVAEFTREDIAAIPIATDGKFRVRRCSIVAEKSLEEIGWPPKVEKKKEEAAS
jgi:hypothetical protein